MQKLEGLPVEVSEFLAQREDLNDANLMINVLSEELSAEQTAALRQIPIANLLGLVVLDNANDSNPYCYISHGVAAGMVAHFNHDREPRIEFACLREFEAFLRKLRATGGELGESVPPSPFHPDQTALSTELKRLCEEENQPDAEFLLCLYIPLLHGEHGSLLLQLSRHSDFFVREAIAEAIAGNALHNTAPALRVLVEDPHPQVRAAAKRATKRVESDA
jgi:hypothetical protein